MKNMTECARSAVMLDREISPNLFKVYINDMLLIVAPEATKQGVTVREDTVSGIIFAHDFVGILETPEGMQKQIAKALEPTRKWRVTANAKKRAVRVVVCNDDGENPVSFKQRRGTY